MNYSKIKKYDIANFKGLRTSIFFCGCKHGCKGCFNKEIWDFKSGQPFTEETKQYLFKLLADEHCQGRLSILGGEPLQQGEEMLKFVQDVKKEFPNGHIALWTGYYLSELNDLQKQIISYCDIVVDGRFEEQLSNKKLLFKGSSNQTIWSNNNGKWEVSKYN